MTKFDEKDPADKILLNLVADAIFVGVSIPEYLRLREKIQREETPLNSQGAGRE